MKKKIKVPANKQAQLDAIKHSRPRTLFPRPAVFDDKSKYKRSRSKAETRAFVRNQED